MSSNQHFYHQCDSNLVIATHISFGISTHVTGDQVFSPLLPPSQIWQLYSGHFCSIPSHSSQIGHLPSKHFQPFQIYSSHIKCLQATSILSSHLSAGHLSADVFLLAHFFSCHSCSIIFMTFLLSSVQFCHFNWVPCTSTQRKTSQSVSRDMCSSQFPFVMSSQCIARHYPCDIFKSHLFSSILSSQRICFHSRTSQLKFINSSEIISYHIASKQIRSHLCRSINLT